MPPVSDDDRVFKALGDPTRRFLLDLLFEHDGRTLTDLESGLEMTRFGVMKQDRKSTRLNSSHPQQSRMPSSA